MWHKYWTPPIVLLTLVTLCAVWPVRAADDDAPTAGELALVPVEPDMHEFMEYAFEPVFHPLKEAMATEPKDGKGWKAVKAGGLLLAESGNLLMMRAPTDDAEEITEWNKLSVAMRVEAQNLYRAGKSRTYADAKTSYTAMVARCNACHDRFADGEHQQKAF
ncbi:MAG: cytochrome c [Planctomycetales bacterium]|nr:cytochrome c [Planctomycetales bacterium]